ncbi:MAG: Mov34/MPN/PAD-1 family protein [Candidatus Kariarchaeaceae archaeon]|jgi:proteasome lid subunit RPN8/RPN11
MADPKMIQISLKALAKMVKFDLSKPGTETVGLLIGYEEAGTVCVEDIRLGEQTGNAVHVEISEAELTQAAIEISTREDGYVIVGWVHTHPGLSAFLSNTDIKTQSLYQALMPNAIAVVIDPVQYGKSWRLDDLDMKVFRVVNDKAVEMGYTITNTVEFGLNTFVSGNSAVAVNTASTPTSYRIGVPSRAQLRMMRARLASLQDDLAEEDYTALSTWLDLVAAMESGDIKEVPVEVDVLMDRLDGSLGDIHAEIESYREQLEYRKAERTLFGIFLGLIVEFALFFFLFG